MGLRLCFFTFASSTARFLLSTGGCFSLRTVVPICDACGGRCLAGISETEARSLGAVAVAKPLDGCGWLGMVMMMVMLIWVLFIYGLYDCLRYCCMDMG
jgi:hypothetical protein